MNMDRDKAAIPRRPMRLPVDAGHNIAHPRPA
jgi:hypothetical protein